MGLRSPVVRRGLLVLHVASSVGWLGAVVVSTMLAVMALVSPDADVVRAVWLVMPAIGWEALLPLSLLSLATGVVQSLGTRWGLFRHYWVLIKLALNLLASIVLLLYLETLDRFAAAARAGAVSTQSGGPVDASPLVHGLGALALLVIALVLSVFKPAGMTPYGVRRARQERAEARVAVR